MSKKYFTFNQVHDEASDSYSPNLRYSSYNSFDTISPQFSSGSPYHDTDSISDKSKKIRKKRNTYQKINDETRKKLLDAVQQGDTLKAAAKRYGINYSSAKSILHTYRKEGRICKKSAQERTSRRRGSKTSQDLEMSPIYPYKQCQEDYNGVHEASTYQTYHSPEKSCETSEDEGPKAGVSGLTINSFGGFLKVGSQNQLQKVENLSSKAPGSTIMLKLESQRLQKVQNVETRNMPNRNWQLNVNVHNENQPPYKYMEEAQNEAKGPIRQGNYGNFYVNYTNTPLSQVGRKKEEHTGAAKEYEAYTDIAAVMEESHVPFDGQSYDVSYFLNSSSPAYAFQQQKAYGLEQCANGENFSSMDHLRGIVDPQEMYYDGLNYRPKMEENTAGMMKRAGLSSY